MLDANSVEVAEWENAHRVTERFNCTHFSSCGISITSPCAAADCDANGTVDQLDSQNLSDCLLGLGSRLSAGSGCFDFDAAVASDLVDFAEFQSSFAGPL